LTHACRGIVAAERALLCADCLCREPKNRRCAAATIFTVSPEFD
jgi:hypothetical protein